MKVSVLVIAYNHEQFIVQAIESVLCQETSFDFEIVVGEDCSHDRTRDILRDYQERYPDKIRLLPPERNLGMMANFIRTFESCCGEYFALLEGDDYWTSPYKLQRQADYLDSHPGCAECFHNVEVVVEGYPEENHHFFSGKSKQVYGIEDIVASNFISTCSTMFRAKQISPLPGWFASMPMGDWPLHVLNAENGTLDLLPGTMAAYRVHDGGVWSRSSRAAILERSIMAIEVINEHLESRYNNIINKSIRRWEREATSLLLESSNYRGALRYAARSFSKQPWFQCLFFLKSCLQILILTMRGLLQSGG